MPYTIHWSLLYRFESHSDPRDKVSSLVVVGAGRGSLHRRSHAVLVVLTDKDARQLPQGRHVEGLEYLALVTQRERERGQELAVSITK